MTKTFGLLIGGIIVQVNEDGSGSIKSNLHDSYRRESFGTRGVYREYEGAINGLESLILAHACCGVDILTKEYRDGVQTALDAIDNHIADI